MKADAERQYELSVLLYAIAGDPKKNPPSLPKILASRT